MFRATGPQRWGLLAAVAAFLLLYANVLVSLARDWASDDNYSHGFLIIPIAGYLIWERRHALASSPAKGSSFGLVVVLGSLAMLVAGVLGAERFLTRVSMLGVMAGGVVFVAGWRHLQLARFPLLFLLLMIPVPALLFNQIAFPLQLIASQFGAKVLALASVPVFREGNVIVLASTSLEVAEACSGIRSLISLLTLAIVLGYFTDSRSWVRTVLACSTVPIAIVANGLRVAGTGIAAHYYGPSVAHGFFHSFSGWLVFGFAFGLLLILHRVIALVAAPAQAAEVSAAAA